MENNSQSKVMAEQRLSAEEQQRTTVRMVRGTRLGEMFVRMFPSLDLVDDVRRCIFSMVQLLDVV